MAVTSLFSRLPSRSLPSLTRMSAAGLTSAGPGPEMFQGERDRYHGVAVWSDKEGCHLTEFPARLDRSVAAWLATGVRAVWFHVAPEQADWVPVLVRHGFSFHHAVAGAVSLLRWLPHTEPCNVPSYAHTLVGVGGMVVTDNDQLLVIQERFYTAPHWKLPGGYVDPGENIAEAAIRAGTETVRLD